AFWVILARHHKQLREHPLLAFSFFICTMFFCFPNYWPQYQIYLIIPVAYLLANYLKTPPKRICAISLGIAILTLFIPHNLWQNPLVNQVFLMPLLSMFLYEARALATVV